ncbi:MAG: XapX domain-containing protein [archaeon]
MNTMLIVLATLTGICTGLTFGFFEVPMPAPPNFAGVMGIVGIFLGYRLADTVDYGFDLLEALGI